MIDNEQNNNFDKRNDNEQSYKGRQENNNDKKEILKNEAEIELLLCGKDHTVKSNKVETKLVELTVKKEQNCAYAFCGDKVEFKVTVCNESDVDLKNIKFKDELENEFEFERETFKVDNRKESAQFHDHTISYIIHELKARQQKVITFECEICCKRK